MKDLYLYDEIAVLRNLLHIKDASLLAEAEANITYIKLLDIDNQFEHDAFDYNRLKAIHKYIFGDIYAWAGEERTIPMTKGERVLGGDTVRYEQSDDITQAVHNALNQLNNVDWTSIDIQETAEQFSILIARLWQIHPFREGNTRTVITFAMQFAQAHGFPMNKQLFKEHAEYVRDALVKASDGPYSEYEYLQKIVGAAILMG